MVTSSLDNLMTADTGLISALLSGHNYWPTEPADFDDLGLSEPFVESLILKLLRHSGNLTGRSVTMELCLPFRHTEPILERLRTRRLITHCGSARLNDYVYGLTEEGRGRALSAHEECSYVGPAPVPLNDYVIATEAQAVADDPVRKADLAAAFHDVSITPELLDLLGPAVNSGAGIFLFGAPGNGKSTLAARMTSCFGQEMWIPHALHDGRDLITLFDPAYHHPVSVSEDGPAFDRRWVRITRPTVVVGGELTMDNLEIRHDPATNISEAPLQLKSNGGCLLIDDFGRQRISPAELLNRWIVPLENHHDYLTLSSGKKIRVPFLQLIIFSTNLDPADLVDEAFLRRLPYRIEVNDPSRSEFHDLFRRTCERMGCRYRREAVEFLLTEYYDRSDHPRRRCHARDLLLQLKSYCLYQGYPFELREEHLERIAPGFFLNSPLTGSAATTAGEESRA